MYNTIYTKTQSQIKVRKKQHFLIFSKQRLMTSFQKAKSKTKQKLPNKKPLNHKRLQFSNQ